MRIYISDLNKKTITEINNKVEVTGETFKPHVLFPFAHEGSGRSNSDLFDLIDNQHICSSLMVDSGTYVMHKLEQDKGVVFDYKNGFKKYCFLFAYLSENKQNVGYYINYDVSFDVRDAFAINSIYQEKMENQGLNPIYVLHTLNNDEIQYVYDKEYKFVAMSSAMLSKSGDFQKANDIVEIFYNQGIRTHLLGCASYNKLSDTYAWSCDASSYARWAGLAKVIFYSEVNKKEVTLSLSTFNSKNEENEDYYGLLKNQKLRQEYDDFIYTGLGFLIDDIAGDESGQLLIQANAYYMYCLEKRITEIQKSKGIDFQEW